MFGSVKNLPRICMHLKCVQRLCSSSSVETASGSPQKTRLKDGPSLEHFIANSTVNKTSSEEVPSHSVSYLSGNLLEGRQRKVYFDVRGCQMNVSDTEVVWAILQKNGYIKTDNMKESDVILVMTCAIREGAEHKIWKKLHHLSQLKTYQKKKRKDLKIGILGCMAERLKADILERDKSVDLVCGPDAYRDLPHMLAVTETGHSAVNVALSLEETYADIVPVRLNTDSPTAFVSIMRGCDNMCTYCIVPFTRGRERSRPMSSILDEIRALSDMGIKEVTLLGQNVNSYRDLTSKTEVPGVDPSKSTVLVDGFKTVYKPKKGGVRFSELLDKVSLIDPEMRIRFTSPHPKDFPDEVLELIKERPNICNQIHLPAQSGSSAVLKAMRRGYSRESYLTLVEHIKNFLPGVSLSSDFISGFCGESEEDHEQTLSLMKLVNYNWAYCFPYSMRKKTHAFHKLDDNVAEEVKSRRHMELIGLFREQVTQTNRDQHGQRQLLLVEGTSKRSDDDLQGRNDGNTKVIIPQRDIIDTKDTDTKRCIKPGDYVVVEITDSSSQVLKGRPLYHTTLQEFVTESHPNHLSAAL